MEYVWIALMAIFTFGICFGLDKLFTRLFRNRSQHKSGKQVRLRSRVALYGLLMLVLGVACAVFYFRGIPFLFWSGVLLILMGAGLVAYYLGFGVFYDEEGFLCTSFGKKGRVYPYGQICSQQLYNSQGSIVVELQMEDGKVIHVQEGMEGWREFLDYAFQRWLEAKGLTARECSFHDTSKCCWFPHEEDK